MLGTRKAELPGLEVIKLEFILRLKIKSNDWLFADTCPQAANNYALKPRGQGQSNCADTHYHKPEDHRVLKRSPYTESQ